MKSVFITGSNGVIGNQVLRMLSENNQFKLFAAYFNSSENIAGYKNVEAFRMDLREKVTCDEKPDFIIHCAASIPSTFEDQEAIKNNEWIDKNVIDFAVKNQSRLIYCSTSSIYNGKSGNWSEKDPVEPDNLYAKQKLSSEKRIGKEIKDHIIFRINAPYHYSQKHSTVLKKFILNAAEDKDLLIYGEGKREQNFIHAADVANLIGKSLEGNATGIYNAGGEKNIKMKELAEMIISLTKSRSKIVYTGLPDPNESIIPRLDITSAKKNFNWQPEISLEVGIMEWFKAIKN